MLEAQHQFQKMLDLNSEAFKRAAEQAKVAHDQIGPFFADFERMQQNLNLNQFSDAVAAVNSLSADLSDRKFIFRLPGLNAELFDQQIKPQFQAVSKLADQFRSISDSVAPQFAPIQAVIDRWAISLNSFSEFEEFNESFGGHLLEQLAAVAASETDDELKKSLDGVVSVVDSQTDGEKKLLAWLGLLFTMVSFFFTVGTFIDQKEGMKRVEDDIQTRLTVTEEYIQARLTDIETKIDEINHELHDDKEPGTVYVTTKHVNLRAGPTTKSEILAKLYPNMLVLLLDKKESWLNVQVYDFVDCTVQEGWVYKRNLKEVRK